MHNVGVNEFGYNAQGMLGIDDPVLDWCALEKGIGFEGKSDLYMEMRALAA